MKTLSPKGMKWLKFFHVLCAICWIGSAFGMNVLKHFIDTTVPGGRYILSLAIKLLDDELIYIGVSGCLITGIIYGCCTKWGFFKHQWLTLKWILTFVMIVLGTFIIGPAVTGNVHPDLEWYTTNLSEYTRNMSVTAWWGGSQIIILLIVLYLSVFKPTKKKNNARV